MTAMHEIPDDEIMDGTDDTDAGNAAEGDVDAELEAADSLEADDAQDEQQDGAPGDAPTEPVTAGNTLTPPTRSANIGHN